MSFQDEAAREAPKALVECRRCGTSFDDASWQRAELVGYQADGQGGLLELRNCGCGSTHSVELPHGDARYYGALFLAVERLLKLGEGRVVVLRSEGGHVYVDAEDTVGGAVECQGQSLELAFGALVESLPPATNYRSELLERLVRDTEPRLSSEYDLRRDP